jgi:hypothetical protein
MFGGMMRDMHGPEDPDLMIPAMQPVVQEVFRQQQQQPIGKDIGNGDPVMMVAELQDHQVNAAEEQVDAAVEQHKIAIGKRIFPGIDFFVLTIIAKKEFQPNDDDIDRGADENKYLFPEVFHCRKVKPNNAPLQQRIVNG